MLPVAEVQSVSLTYGSQPVLEGVSFSLHPATFYCLIGRNGVGKSTLLKLLSRQEIADRGRIYLFGFALDSDSAALSASTVYVSESTALPSTDSVARYMRSLAKVTPSLDMAVYDEWIYRFRVPTDRPFDTLSRGQRVQVSLAIAFALNPQLILLDEVTSVLDAAVRRAVIEELQRRAAEGACVVVATNIVSEVENVNGHILLLDYTASGLGGKIALDAPMDRTLKRFKKIRRELGDDHEVFRDPLCFEVGTNTDGSLSYLLQAERLENYKVHEAHSDRRKITLDEIFTFYVKLAQANEDPLKTAAPRRAA